MNMRISGGSGKMSCSKHGCAYCCTRISDCKLSIEFGKTPQQRRKHHLTDAQIRKRTSPPTSSNPSLGVKLAGPIFLWAIAWRELTPKTSEGRNQRGLSPDSVAAIHFHVRAAAYQVCYLRPRHHCPPSHYC